MALKLDSRFCGNDKTMSVGGFLPVITIFFVAILFFAPAPTRAGILPACSATGACQVCDVVNVFVTLGKWLMVSAGGLALLVITWAAFGLVSSAGNPEKITGAKKQITGAILGVGITLAAFQLVSLLIATLAVPSGNQGFAEQTSEDTGKFASLSGFLGIPWWNICNVKELRKLGATKQTDITYKGTGVCRYWGDGTPCQEISEEREKKLVECGYLEGNSDLTPEEKEKQEKECQAAKEKILRCCQGACSDKECITKKISRPIAQSSTAYQGQATMLAGPGECGQTNPTQEATVRAKLSLNKVYISASKIACPISGRYQDVSGGCTTVGGVRDYVIDRIIAVRKVCPLDKNCIYISGGNECGHAAAGNHSKGIALDIDVTGDTKAPNYIPTVLDAMRNAGINKASPDFAPGYTCEASGAAVDCSRAAWLHVTF